MSELAPADLNAVYLEYVTVYDSMLDSIYDSLIYHMIFFVSMLGMLLLVVYQST